MIKVTNLTRSFNKKKVLDDVSLSFEKRGLVALLGPSGSGKSTLLNILSLNDFEYGGTLLINGTNPKKLKDKAFEKFRLKNVSLVFQDFNLLNVLDISSNINVPSDISHQNPSSLKRKRDEYYLGNFSLSNKLKSEIPKLSGGEQQRLCLIRALNADSKILLLDEPTGALDEKNGTHLFEYIKSISKTKLVIVATHDEENIKKYADKIYRISDGKITECIDIEEETTTRAPTIISNINEKSTPTIPLSLIYKHYRGVKKKRRFRSFVTSFVTSISLFCVGASVLLSNSLQKGITNAFSENLQNDSIIMTSKSPSNENIEVVCSSYESTKIIQKELPQEVLDITPYYFTNFEDVFYEGNDLFVAKDGPRFYIECFQIREVNDFVNINTISHKTTFFPNRPQVMDNLDVVLGLPYHFMERLCFNLQIERSYQSLGEYIDFTSLYLTLSLIKSDWGYEKDITFKVEAVYEDEEAKFLHSNSLWSQIILEEYFQFSSSLNLSRIEANPWTFKKGYAISVRNEEDFLAFSRSLANKEQYLFEAIGDHKFIVYENKTNFLTYKDYENVCHISESFKFPIFSTYGFYGVYGNSLLQGFSKPLYLSSSQDKSDLIIDTLTNLAINSEDFLFDKKEQIVAGYFPLTSDVVRFSPLESAKLHKGRMPNNLDEVVISEALANYIGIKDLESELFLDFVINESKQEAKVYREFVSRTLRVTGIVKSSQLLIYQAATWLIDYPLLKLGVSPFFLLPFNITFLNTGVNGSSEQLINTLNSSLHEYDFSNPIHAVNESVSKILHTIEIVLAVFALITFFLSAILLNTTIYLNLVELKRDLGLLRINGASKNQIRKMIVLNVFFSIFSALLISFVELVVMNFVISYLLMDIFSSAFTFYFSLTPFLLTLFTSVVTSLIISMIILFRFRSLDTNRLLKY